RNCACTRRSPFWLSTVFDGIMSVMRLLRTAVVVTVTLAGGLATGHALAGTARAALPRPDHVVVVVEENHPFGKVIGPAPYITSLANGGAKFTASFAVTHPSEPNYIALFSGSTHGVTSDTCGFTCGAENLGHQLLATGHGFTGYSESLPSDGFTGCASGRYARKHSPWALFTNVPATGNLRFSRFPTDFSTLPTVALVTPNLDHDMHDGSVAAGDAWLRTHLDAYARWARTHNSLLTATFDEDDRSASNQIPTLFAGPMVKPGSYGERITHYSVLRTVEDMYGLPCVGAACTASPIADVWH